MQYKECHSVHNVQLVHMPQAQVLSSVLDVMLVLIALQEHLPQPLVLVVLMQYKECLPVHYVKPVHMPQAQVL